MKPPVSRHPEIVRGRILDAAQDEFLRFGFAGASTNRILAAFGGSKPTMFRHFPSKRELLKGVVARIANRWVERTEWERIHTADPATWMREFFGRATSWVLGAESLALGRLAIAEAHEFPEVSETYRQLAYEPIVEVIATRLQDWNNASLLRCGNPRNDAEMLVDLIISGLATRCLYDVDHRAGPAIVEARINDAIELFLHGRASPRT